MAFCPHCGKTVTDQASKCIVCGKEFEPRAKAARFKGTMMMSPEVAPAAPLQSAPEPRVEAPAPMAAAPVVASAAPRPTTPGPSKVMKGTMLGTGGAGFAPPAAPFSGGGTKPQIGLPPPAAGMAMPQAAPAPSDVAFADTGRQPAQGREEAPEGRASAGREDSQRFLAGDPMAPAQPGLHTEGRVTGKWRGNAPAPRTGLVLGIGIGGFLLIAGVGFLVGRMMGLY